MIESYIFTSSMRELLALRRSGIWIVASVIVTVLVLALKTMQAPTSAVSFYASMSGMFVFRVGALIAVVLSGYAVSQEVEQKTIVYLLTREVPRWKLYVFRGLAIACTTFLLTTLCCILVAAIGCGINPMQAVVFRDLSALLIGSFAYTALFMFISLLLNKSMVVCLLYAFAWETAVPNMRGSTFYLAIASYMKSVAQHKATEAETMLRVLSGSMSDQVISKVVVWIAMPLFVIGVGALGAWWFTTHEYIPREDGE